MDITSGSVDSLVSALSSQQAQRESIAYSALGRGATRFAAKEYDLARIEFQRAVAFKPDLIEAQRYLGATFAAQGRTEEAVLAYRRAVQVDPAATEAREDLARLYMTNERYPEAEQEFLQIAKLHPTWAGPAASLGHIYLATGRLAEAETQLAKAVRLSPNEAAAHYSLGLVFHQEGRYREAVSEFERAIQRDRGYAAAYADLAYSYLALEQPEMAESQVQTLLSLQTEEATALAGEVQLTMYTPKILFQDATSSSFPSRLGPGTSLADLDPTLAAAGASETFTIVLQFNQRMDIGSVQNVYNWSIRKATGGPGGAYNYGANLFPQADAAVSPIPVSVSYDPRTYRATIRFRILQNAAADARIDPSHLVFQFRGTDVSGNSMDPSGDEYDGSAGSAF
ncbi:MAG: tetratricopeptide repeat protein [Candidatus Eisenbacteria bacterium]